MNLLIKNIKKQDEISKETLNKMNHKNLEQLDFFRVREIVSSFAMTQEGKQTVLSILPYTDKKQISNAKMRLATQSEQASNEYIAALNQRQLQQF